MKISELIKKLQEEKQKHGDVPVAINYKEMYDDGEIDKYYAGLDSYSIEVKKLTKSSEDVYEDKYGNEQKIMDVLTIDSVFG